VPIVGQDNGLSETFAAIILVAGRLEKFRSRFFVEGDEHYGMADRMLRNTSS
jgi:hypothetical protein